MLYGKYVWEFAPHSQMANRWGWAAQHRLIGEAIAGRPLVQSKNPRLAECVHHKDENPLNNDPSNLEVMTMSAHRAHHTSLMMERRRAPITYDMTVKALEGRSLKDAARMLNVDTMTLRNRFPELINPRKRRSPAKIDDAKIAKVLAAACKGNVTLAAIAAELSIGVMTASRICRRAGVAWPRQSRKSKLNATYRKKPIPRR